MEKQVHGVPALLSLFFPGLGQLVKGQWERAVLVWGLVFGPWIILGATVAASYASVYSAPDIRITLQSQDIVPIMLQSPFLPVVLLLNLIVQLWAVVDAYNRPV